MCTTVTLEHARRLIISCWSSSRSSSSSSLPTASALPDAWKPANDAPLAFGWKGSTTMGSVPLISQRQNGQPWPSDSWWTTVKVSNAVLTLYNYKTVGIYLPRRQTGSAHQVSAGLDLHVFVILGTDLTQLERRSHLAVQLVLFLQADEEAEGSVTFNSVWRR